MNAFAQNYYAKLNRRGLKAALLSTIPGLGQLYNRRLDKAIAFFLVDLVNAAFLALVMGARIPYIDYQAAQWLDQLSTWRPGSAPGIVLQLIMLSYVVYAQIDAYMDAEKSELAPCRKSEPHKPEFNLSISTCASYLMHMGTALGICFLIFYKIIPVHQVEERPQILSFELELSPSQEPEKIKGTEGKIGEESNRDESAHLKDRPKNDEIKASSPSKEIKASAELEAEVNNIAAQETAAVASKQIVTPESKQSPVEVSSHGASETAEQRSKVENQETHVKEEEQLSGSQAQKVLEQPLPDRPLPTEPSRSKLIASLPPLASLANGTAPAVEETKGQINQSAPSVIPAPGTVQWQTRQPEGAPIDWSSLEPSKASEWRAESIIRNGLPSVSPVSEISSADFITEDKQAPFAGLYSYNQGTPVSKVNSSKPSGAPSMLGFMDSSLSNDADMRAFWAEMSGNLSRQIKAHPLQGSGLAVCSFKMNRYGQPTNVESYPPQSRLAESLTQTLQQSPAMLLSIDKLNRMNVQVKASNDANVSFVSVEISSQASPVSSETLSDFKYQVTLQAYLKDIKKSVYSSWKPPVQEGVKPVMLGFRVTTDGRITNQHIVQSSGDPDADRAALNAALSISKWSQPPAGTSEDMDVCMVLQKCKNCDGEEKKAPRPALPVSSGHTIPLSSASINSRQEAIIHSTGVGFKRVRAPVEVLNDKF